MDNNSFIIIDGIIINKKYNELLNLYNDIKNTLNENEYDKFEVMVKKFLNCGPIFKSFIIDDNIVYKFCGFYYT